jgi:hypothetical protein
MPFKMLLNLNRRQDLVQVSQVEPLTVTFKRFNSEYSFLPYKTINFSPIACLRVNVGPASRWPEIKKIISGIARSFERRLSHH